MIQLKNSFRSRLVLDTAYVYIGTFFSRIFGILSTIVFARLLGAFEYGLLTLAITVVSIICIFLDLQLGLVVTKFTVDYLSKAKHGKAVQLIKVSFLSNVLLLAVLSIIIISLAPFISHNILHKPDKMVNLIRIYAFVGIGEIFVAIPYGILQALKKFKLITSLDIIYRFFRFLISVTLVRYGVIGVVYGYLFAQILHALMITLSSIRVIKHTFPLVWEGNDRSFFSEDDFHGRGARKEESHFEKEEFIKILKFCLHCFVSSSLKTIKSWLDVLMLGIFRSAQEVAYYKIGMSLAEMMSFIAVPLTRTVYPTLTELWNQNDIKKCSMILRRATLYIFIMSSIFAAILWFFGKDFILHTVSSEFINSITVTKIVMLGMILANSVGWVRACVLAIGEPQLSTKMNILLASLIAISCLLLIPKYGYVGAAWGFSIATSCVALIFLALINKRIPLIMLKQRYDS